MKNDKNISIFLSCDDNFAPLAAVTIASICHHTKSFIDFYILDSGITKLSKKRIEKLKEKFQNFSVEYINIDLDKYFKDYVETNFVTRDTYSKYLIPWLKPELDKAIYSDVDVVILDDIKEMYDIDLKDTFAGGCRRYYGPDDEHLKNDLEMTDEELKGYAFQCGNLLINCKKWREENILEKLLEVHRKYKEKVFGVDQDALFKVFKNNFTPIHLKFCATTLIYDGYFKNEPVAGHDLELKLRSNSKKDDVLKELQEAVLNPTIRHYETKNKPWTTDASIYSGKKMPFFKEFWYFARMTDFYDDILINLFLERTKLTINKNNENRYKVKNIKLFNFIPLFKIKQSNNRILVKLFNFIPLLKIKLK